MLTPEKARFWFLKKKTHSFCVAALQLTIDAPNVLLVRIFKNENFNACVPVCAEILDLDF